VRTPVAKTFVAEFVLAIDARHVIAASILFNPGFAAWTAFYDFGAF